MHRSSDKFGKQRKSELAICFARMYGIKETLEPLEFLEQETVIRMVRQWAEEFLESSSRDVVQFFEEKSACLKTADQNVKGEKEDE